MELKFSPVTLDKIDDYYHFWLATHQHSLDYTLANLWGWQEYYGLEWHFSPNLCWLRQTLPETINWAPLGNWQAVDWAKELSVFPADAKIRFHRVPDELVHIWQKSLPECIQSEDERGQWEYLYSQEELATLPGGKFHKKKNHYNSYVKTYGEPDYRDIDEQMIKRVLQVQDAWCHWHECEDSPSLTAENLAVNRVLDNWGAFRGLVGGTLSIDGKMVAFSVGEALDKDHIGVHFEKALNGYRGIYQAMNCEFAKHAATGFKWINRAQDLDEEGMRQAKMTYQPAGFLKKYNVVLNNA